jgi:hypothetical protein
MRSFTYCIGVFYGGKCASLPVLLQHIIACVQARGIWSHAPRKSSYFSLLLMQFGINFFDDILMGLAAAKCTRNALLGLVCILLTVMASNSVDRHY